MPVALAGLIVLITLREMLPVESECPACDAMTWFEFFAKPSYARCLECLAYAVRRDERNDQIAEAPIEMTSDVGFKVYNEQYKDIVQRGDNGRVIFALPSFCAMCGSAATHARSITIRFRSSGGKSNFWRGVNYARSGTPGRDSSYVRSEREAISGENFRGMEIPVCAKHLNTQEFLNPVEVDDSGNLDFASYRFYKAFIAANHIVLSGIGDGPNESVPSARIME